MHLCGEPNLEKKIQSTIETEQGNLSKQLKQMNNEINELIIKAAEKEIHRELERRENAERLNKEKTINSLQDLWNHLYEERQILIREHPLNQVN